MTTNVQGKEILVQPSVADGDSVRVCIPTWRLFRPLAARCAFYEAQDVFLEVDNVDLIPLETGASFEWKEKWQRRLLWRDFTGKVAHLNPGIKPVKLRRDYELLVVTCQQIWELLYLNAIGGWRDRCRLAVCWLDELWAADIPLYHYWFNTLNQFDHVFVGLSESARVLDRTLGRPCHYLPSAVDVLRFNPYPTPADRVIDVLSIGRRWDGIHRSLLELAGARDIFYVHDTARDAGDMILQDVREHRDLLANMIKRSRFFLVTPAKMAALAETGGQIEVGLRYFEGAAGGAVLLGHSPDCEAFRVLFDWPEVVIPIQKDGSDVREVLCNLSAQPEYLGRIGKRNAACAARRHDWVHRWQTILEVTGMASTPALGRRLAQLEALAEMAEPSTEICRKHC